MPNGDMADEATYINSDFPFEIIQVFAVGMPVPINALLQGKARDGLDAHETLDQRVFVSRFHRRERQAAIAHYHRCDAVLRLTGAVGIPEHLRVEMGMMIDKAGGNSEPVGINRLRGASPNPAEFDHSAILDANISDI